MSTLEPQPWWSVLLEHEPVQDAQRAAGTPAAATTPLDAFSSCEVGIWEQTTGSMTDVEADEIFVVLAGRATVTLLDDGTTIDLVPGTVCALREGTRTRWDVHEDLRKLYVAGTREETT